MHNRHSTWGMGNKRSFNEYMKMVGIDTLTKKVTVNTWCHRGGSNDVAAAAVTANLHAWMLACLTRSDTGLTNSVQLYTFPCS